MIITVLSYLAAGIVPAAYVTYRLKGDRTWAEAMVQLRPIWRPR